MDAVGAGIHRRIRMSETTTASDPAITIDLGSMATSMLRDACYARGPEKFIGEKPVPPGTAEDI